MNILSLTYLGNVRWFTKLCLEECVIDIYENYLKQSFRNRCEIGAANGRTTLTVNVVKGSNFHKTSVKDTRIDYSKRWGHLHWQSLVSAYKGSPYFDHYRDLFAPFYERRYDFLIDLNTDLLETVAPLLGGIRISYSDKYVDTREFSTGDPVAGGNEFAMKNPAASLRKFPAGSASGSIGTGGANDSVGTGGAITDLRDAISPKPRLDRPDPDFDPVPYWQVFSDKRPFEANLSVVDLLFCEGPRAIEVIRASHTPTRR